MYRSHSNLFEANLANINDLRAALDQILKNKNISTGPIYNWFMKQYINWYKSSEDEALKSLRDYTPKEGDPEWMTKPGISEFVGFDDNTKNSINHMIDYFNTLSDDELKSIHKETYPVINKKVEDWTTYLQSSKGKLSTLKKGLSEGKDYKVIKRVGDRYMWVHLLTKAAYQCEGEEMSHCVGTYTPGQSTILSLWDNNLGPHVTIEIQNGKKVYQIKGKGDRPPVEKYQEATREFIKELIEQGYTITGDGGNIGMLGYEGKFYFEEDPKWQKIYTTVILPKQEKAIQEIQSQIKDEQVDIDSLFTSAKAAISKVPKEMQSEFSSLIDEIKSEIASVRNESNVYYKNLKVLFG